MIGDNYSLYLLDLLKEIDDMADKYAGSVRNLSPVEKTEKLKKMEESFAKAKELSDDKVQLAMQTYEMVNNALMQFYKAACSGAGCSKVG